MTWSSAVSIFSVHWGESNVINIYRVGGINENGRCSKSTILATCYMKCHFYGTFTHPSGSKPTLIDSRSSPIDSEYMNYAEMMSHMSKFITLFFRLWRPPAEKCTGLQSCGQQQSCSTRCPLSKYHHSQSGTLEELFHRPVTPSLD